MTRSLLFFLLFTALLLPPATANQLPQSEVIELNLRAAALRETLASFGALSGAELDLADGVDGTVDLEIREAWPKVLDRICRDHHLFCEFLKSEPPILRVRRADPAADYPLPEGLGEAINLSLKDGDLRQTLTLFGAISEHNMVIAEGIEGGVTMEVKSTPWPLVLIEICRLAGCEVIWGDGAIEIVEAKAVAPIFNMNLKDAKLKDVVETFPHVIGTNVLGSEIEVKVDEAVEDRGVTVDLQRINWREALGLICENADCVWSLEYGDPTVLRVESREDKPKVMAAGLEEPGAAAKRLAYRFTPPGGTAVAGTAVFSWAGPIHLVESPGLLRARLHWLPFGPELSVVLPLVERCGARSPGGQGGPSSVTVLEPVILPIADEVNVSAEGATLLLAPAANDAASKNVEASAVDPCGSEPEGVIEVLATRLGGEETRQPPRRRFTVQGLALVTPIGARQPIAAVVALGGGLDKRQGLALLSPTDDRSSVTVETLSLALGERVERVVEAGKHRFELRLGYVEKGVHKPEAQ